MKKLCFTLASILLATSIFAANVNWLGGTGNWTNTAKWSTGAVPTSSDDVVIPANSTVNINSGVAAFAKSVDNAGTLAIKAGSSLTVAGSNKTYALRNTKKLIVRGFLSIDDTNGVPSLGIYTLDTLLVEQSGVVNIEGFGYGLDNWHYSSNLGLITISMADIAGVQQYTNGTFINGATGSLTISNVDNGLLQTYNSSFTNEGSVEISLVETGISTSESDITNTTSGSINISDADDYGVFMNREGTCINRGDLTIEATKGLWLSNTPNVAPGPTFENTAAGNMVITAGTDGLLVPPQFSAFTNSGIMEVTAPNLSIINHGPAFINNVCAEMYVNGRVSNSSTGVIQNNAKWTMNSTTASINAGSFQNFGILEDNYAVLSPLITNSRIVVRPIAGPLTAGVAVANTVDAVSWGTFQTLGIYTDQAATTSAGTFAQATNTFTPNAAAVGLPDLYIKIRRGANQCPEVMRIAVSNPLMPGGSTSNLVFNFDGVDGVDHQFDIYPNPTSGNFSLQAKAADGPMDVLVSDAFGRSVFHQSIDFKGGGNFEFEKRMLLSGAGIYFIRIFQNGTLAWQQRLLVMEE